MENKEGQHRSILIDWYGDFIDFTNKYFTLSKYVIRDHKDIFYRIEKMMLTIFGISIITLLTLHLMPKWLGVTMAILFGQRVLEFIFVYSRNFIFNKGRVFTDIKDTQRQGEWLILMFSLSAFQMVIIFAIWYRLIGLLDPSSFTVSMSILDSLYFSVINFLTVGFGDISPVSDLAKILVIFQGGLTFYTLVIVVNGLISIHFIKN